MSKNNNEQDKLSNHIPIYNWITHDGKTNIATWIEAAVKKAGKYASIYA